MFCTSDVCRKCINRLVAVGLPVLFTAVSYLHYLICDVNISYEQF